MLAKDKTFYYCDEHFSYIQSDIEKRIFGVMLDRISNNERLIFTTHNTDIERLHEKVTALKRLRGLEAKYMTFEELLKRRESKGKAEGITEGKIEGIAETVLTLLEVYGTVPEDVRERILSERHLEVLKDWTKLAAQVDSVEEFVSKMQEESAQI